MTEHRTLTAARLRDLVRYEPDGTLHWRNPVGTKMKRGPLGAPAGRGGRLQTPIDGTAHYVHRLVWLYHYGKWPTAQLDHIDRDKRNNRIGNLREATNAENLQNRLPAKGGVSFDKRKGSRPWRARIMVNGRSISLGYYDTRDEAEAEYNRAKLAYHPFYVSGVPIAA